MSVLTGTGLDGVDLEKEDEDGHEVRHVPGEPEDVHLAGRYGLVGFGHKHGAFGAVGSNLWPLAAIWPRQTNYTRFVLYICLGSCLAHMWLYRLLPNPFEKNTHKKLPNHLFQINA